MPKATLSQAELLRKQREALSEVVIDVETMAIFDSLPGFLCFLKNRAGEHLYASGLWTTRHGFREAWEMLFKTDQDLTPGAMAESYLADDAIVVNVQGDEPLLAPSLARAVADLLAAHPDAAIATSPPRK